MAHFSMQHVRSGPPSLPSRPRFREPSVSCHPTTTCSTRHADGQQIWRLNSHQVPWCKSLVAAGAALALAVSTALAAEDLTISFKASRNPEIRKAQKSLVEAWGYVETQFMEPDFDHQSWSRELQNSLNETYKATSADDAYLVTDNMLKTLGDPFTRLLRPGRQATAFQNTTEGQVNAIGLQLAPAPGNRLQVGLVLQSSPAQAAGIRPGDEVMEINGLNIQDKSRQDWAEVLKCEAEMRLVRQSQPDASDAAQPESYTVHLKPGPIEVHPVQYAALTRPDGVTGYIRVVVFSQNAAADVQHAIQELTCHDGASAFILDLRDNSGGVVASGYSIAQMLLKDGDGFCVVKFGTGEEETVHVQEASHLLSQPLVVLVNGGTASTSELLAGALHDSAGVPLVGEKTFGKGITQRVVPLSDGSVLLVSTATYMTPNRVPVHKVTFISNASNQVLWRKVYDYHQAGPMQSMHTMVGLRPDIACVPEVTEAEYWVSGSRDADDLTQDPCIQIAQDTLQQRTVRS